jgi:hypothetical protein
MVANGHEFCSRAIMLTTSYILPIRRAALVEEEFVRYVHELSRRCEVLIVDGSPRPVFDDLAARCGSVIRHVAPDPDLKRMANGKVAGVITGVRRSSHERLVIADDDVRYELPVLERISRALDDADVVRPQNYFEPIPWHARIDTARTLINRMSGGDWPGTLAVRKSALDRAGGGYCGDVLFENLELVRTVVAAGGHEHIAYGLFVRRRPPSTRHFVSQRVRQAYDEFARPARMATWLAVLPAMVWLGRRRGVTSVASALAATIVCAEAGRRRAGARDVFPLTASLAAPVWVLERAVCAWLALGARLWLGGVPYHGGLLRTAATPVHQLRARHQQRTAR